MTSRASRLDVIVKFANGGSFTPQDLALIEAIGAERSILGASRATGVSYRKCWLMVDAMNRTFETPVFATFPGRRGGGADSPISASGWSRSTARWSAARGARARKGSPS